jgi:hypothetical protein
MRRRLLSSFKASTANDLGNVENSFKSFEQEK